MRNDPAIQRSSAGCRAPTRLVLRAKLIIPASSSGFWSLRRIHGPDLGLGTTVPGMRHPLRSDPGNLELGRSSTKPGMAVRSDLAGFPLGQHHPSSHHHHPPLLFPAKKRKQSDFDRGGCDKTRPACAAVSGGVVCTRSRRRQSAPRQRAHGGNFVGLGLAHNKNLSLWEWIVNARQENPTEP